jgi:two-component system sensor histidine kinase RpfC
LNQTDKFRERALITNPEFQSAVIRMGVWIFAVVYIGLGASTGRYGVAKEHYYFMFFAYLIAFIGFLISILRRPVWEERRYLSTAVDISATTFCIYMTSVAVHPFYLLYIWIFISAGSRYGKKLLRAASAMSVVGYITVVTILEQWQQYYQEVFFYLVVLVVLPFYQYILLRKLHNARADAERSNRAKGSLLSNITKGLRAPVVGINGMVAHLRNTSLTPEQRDYTDSIFSSATVLNALVGDALDYSKIEAGDLELTTVPFRIRALLYDICSALAVEARDKGVELVCHVDEDLPSVFMGDELRLRQVLFNLAGNAVKFTDSGEVVVRAKLSEQNRSQLQLEVRDTGIGIPKEMQKRIFDSFWQADLPRQEKYGGAGIGTAIAKKLVQLMGGEIGVQSEEGKGSRFWVKLPLQTAEMARAAGSVVSDLRGKKALVYETNGSSLSAILDACGEIGVAAIPIQRIGDLANAITAAEEEGDVDFIIVADSPEGHNVERITEVFRDYLGTNLPVVFLGYRRRTLDLEGMLPNSFLKKPFVPELLETAIISALSD